MRLAKLFDLAGRRALVTGGNSGIGEAMAQALGMAGARVLLVPEEEGAARRSSTRRARLSGAESARKARASSTLGSMPMASSEVRRRNSASLHVSLGR